MSAENENGKEQVVDDKPYDAYTCQAKVPAKPCKA